MKDVNEILTEETVNRYRKDLLAVDSDGTVNSLTVTDLIEKLLKEVGAKPEGIGKMLAEALDDQESLPYYVMLATNHSHGRLFEALSLTKDASRRGTIKYKKAIYFQGILRKWGLQTKFKK